jgi:hypothetical protein
MPPGNKQKNYSPEDVNLACKEIRKKELSIRIASLKFDAPKSASLDRVNYCHGNQIGQPTMLTAEKEALLLEHIQLLAFWGLSLFWSGLVPVCQDVSGQERNKDKG